MAQGTPEIGMRMALGASAWTILRSVLQHGIRIVGIGLSAGAGLAYLGSGFLSSLLFEVSATDPWTYLLIAISFCSQPGWPRVGSLRAGRAASSLSRRYESVNTSLTKSSGTWPILLC